MERAALRGDGFVELASIPSRVAQIEVRIRKVGLEFERAATRCDGFVKPAERAAGFAEVGMSDGIIRVEDDGLTNQIHCEVMAIDLVSDETEEVQRAGMVWLRRKDPAVERLGFCQAPSLVALNRDLKRL